MMMIFRARLRLSAAASSSSMAHWLLGSKISLIKQQQYYGSIAPDDDQGLKQQQLAEKIKSLPEKVNWVEEGVVGPVVDQGYTRSCWAHQTASALNSVFQLATGKPHGFSAQELLDFNAGIEPSLIKTVFKMCIGLHKDDQGGWPVTALEWVCRYGLSFEKDYPRVFNAFKRIKPKIDAVGKVPPFREDYLKLAVASHPVIVELGLITSSFEKYKKGIYREDRKPDDHSEYATHSALVVGYDVIDGGKPVWLVKNSYGKYWGMNGYLYLPREVEDAWVNCYLARRPVYPILNSFSDDLFQGLQLPGS